MNFKSWRFYHKWLAILIGLFFIGWSVSGIVMVLPDEWFLAKPAAPTAQIDYRKAGLSPSQAIEKLEQKMGQEVNLTNLGFKKLQGQLFYAISLQNGSYHLIDAITGESFEITPDVAEKLARAVSGDQSSVAVVESLQSHDLLYPFGPLPVYRVAFDAQGSDLFYVSMINGDVSYSTAGTRLRAAITSLHTFEPLKLITARESFRKGALALTAGISVIVALTGYYLAIQPWLRRRIKDNRSRPSKEVS